MALPGGVSLAFFSGYAATTVLAVSLAVAVLRDGEGRPTDRTFALLSLSTAVWAAGDALQMLASSSSGTLFWHRAGYVGIPAVPVFLLLFALAFTGRTDLLSRRFVAAVAAVPALNYLAVLTNAAHGLYYTDVAFVSRGGVTLLSTEVGVLFWAFAGYNWAMLFVALALLALFALRSRRLYRTQAAVVLFGVLAPWLANLLYNSGGWPYPSLDPTPLVAGVGFGAAGVTALNTEFPDVVPVARESVLQSLEDAVVIVDDRDRVADFNRAAGEVLGLDDGALGAAADAVLPAALYDALGSGDRREFQTTVGGDTCYYSVRSRQVTTRGGEWLGSSLVLHDVTALKQQQFAVERERDLKEAVREALVGSASREAIETALCERLAEQYAVAWTGDLAADSGLSVRAAAGADAAAVEAADAEAAPWQRAIGTGELVVTTEGDWSPVADAGAVAAVPLTRHGLAYGVLVVHSPDAPDGYERRLLSELADTLAFAHNTVDQRAALVGDRIREARLRLTDADHYLVALAGAEALAGTTATVTEVETDEAAVLHFLRVEGADADAVRDAVADHPAVAETTPLWADDAAACVQARVRRPTVATTLADLGGTVQSVRVEGGVVEAVVQFARDVDVEQMLGRFRETFPGTELVSLRDRERTTTAPESVVVDLLTEKQRRALEAAYRSGFFERPQRRTAEEIADELGVSRSTFLHHVREAERRLVGEAFE